MRPLSLLLLGKGLHTNLLILAAKQAVEHSSLVLNTVAQRQVLALVDNLLASHGGNLGVSSNGLGKLERLLHQGLIRREGSGSNSPFLSLHAAEGLAGEDELHGLGLSDGTGKALTATSTRDGAELDFGLTEVGLLSAVDQVAHHGELAAATKGVSGNSGQNGLLDLGRQQRPRLDEGLGIGFGKRQGSHLLDVGTSGESLLGAGQDDDIGVVGGVEVVECFVELLDQRCAESVERLGSVQCNCG